MSQLFSCPTQYGFINLTDVHTRWYAQWVYYDVNWIAFMIVWHIFNWTNLRDNTFVTMASGHLIPNGDFPFLDNISTDQLVNTRWQFISVFTIEDLHIKYDSACTVIV